MSWLSKWWNTISRPRPPVVRPPRPVPTGTDAEQLADLVNHARASRNLSPLALSRALSAGAAAWANDMRHAGRLEHQRPLPDGVRGEIIALGQQSPVEVFRGWQNSPGHNTIMMGGYTACGFGRAGEYWCGTFN